MKNYLRVLYKQGVFTGDLNRVQTFCLNWALADEREDQINLEQERMKYTVLAGDRELYHRMFVDEEEQRRLREEEWRSMEEVDPHEMESIFAEIEQWQSQGEIPQ